jgi:hypothetical protein
MLSMRNSAIRENAQAEKQVVFRTYIRFPVAVGSKTRPLRLLRTYTWHVNLANKLNP